jgi:hypothetical protein
VDLVDTGVSSICHLDPDVVPLVADIHDPRANVVFAITGPRNGTAALLTDYEVPYLGVLSILPDVGDTCPTVDGLFIFGHPSFRVTKVPLCQSKGNTNN